MVSSGLELLPLTSSQKNVIFRDLKPIFQVYESILVEFTVPVELNTHRTDWVGLLPMGWTSVQQYVTFEWVSDSLPSPWGADGVGSTTLKALLFRSEYHAHVISDHQLYQFVYVSKQIEVLGVSAAFKFDLSTSGDFRKEMYPDSRVAQITELPHTGAGDFVSPQSKELDYFETKDVVEMARKINLGCCSVNQSDHFYGERSSEVATLRKENCEWRERCQRAEAAAAQASARSQTFLAALMEALEKHQTVQVAGFGKRIWVRKVDDPEKKVKTTSRVPMIPTQKQLALRPSLNTGHKKVTSVVAFLRKLCMIAEERLVAVTDLVFGILVPFVHYQREIKNHRENSKNISGPAAPVASKEEETFFDAEPFVQKEKEADAVTENVVRIQNKVLEFMSVNKLANAGCFSWKKGDGRFQIEFKNNPNQGKSSGGNELGQIGGKKIEMKFKVPTTRAGLGGERPERQRKVPTGDTTALSEHEILERNFEFLNDNVKKSGRFIEVD